MRVHGVFRVLRVSTLNPENRTKNLQGASAGLLDVFRAVRVVALNPNNPTRRTGRALVGP